MLRAFTQTRQFSRSVAARDVAKTTLIGRIGQDLQTQNAASGRTYLRYPIAVRTGRDETSWFNVSVFDEQAIDFMTKYLKSGSLVYVEADTTVSKYEDKDGNTRSSINFVQSTISPVGWGRKKDGDTESSE